MPARLCAVRRLCRTFVADINRTDFTIKSMKGHEGRNLMSNQSGCVFLTRTALSSLQCALPADVGLILIALKNFRSCGPRGRGPSRDHWKSFGFATGGPAASPAVGFFSYPDFQMGPVRKIGVGIGIASVVSARLCRG